MFFKTSAYSCLLISLLLLPLLIICLTATSGKVSASLFDSDVDSLDNKLNGKRRFSPLPIDAGPFRYKRGATRAPPSSGGKARASTTTAAAEKRRPTPKVKRKLPSPPKSPQGPGPLTTTAVPSTAPPKTTAVPSTAPPTTTAVPSTAPPTTVASLSSTKPTIGASPKPTKIPPSKRGRVPDSKEKSLFSSSKVDYDARDVAYFLESHPAHSVHDPRAYFTEERTSKSLALMLSELKRMPKKLLFAYVVRIFNELGRKMASKLYYYYMEVIPILRKTPDDLGNRPEVSMLFDAINNAFESKEDSEFDSEAIAGATISSLIRADKQKEVVFNSSMDEVSRRLAHIISYFALTANELHMKLSDEKRVSMGNLLGESMQMGAKTLIEEVSKSDKFNVPSEVVGYMNSILNTTLSIFVRHVKDNDKKGADSLDGSFKVADDWSFEELNPISDRTGLVGPWNSYLFNNLGSSERVIKLFACLLTRVPAQAKTRWINMNIAQVFAELERTLSGFVIMQGMPHNDTSSDAYLLDSSRSVQIMPVKWSKPRLNYLADKNRVPARCYLAGRRWRLALSRALKGYSERDDVLRIFADKIGELKLRLVSQTGNEIYRLCLPRVEVGLRGWGINGDPRADGSQTDKFPLKNSIEGLGSISDPFVSGAQLGYKIGFKMGYNEERNATLEIEHANSGGLSAPKEKAASDIDYLAMASYRRAATVGAKKAFEIALREGYLTALKISMRAGILIPSEAGSRLASLKSVTFGGQAGADAGRSAVDSYLAERIDMTENERKALLKVGELHGLLAGELMGRSVGAIVGKEAAEEAYRRNIVRGGKVSQAKFNFDEYEAGGKLGFDYGVREGKRVASSSTLDPSAPRFFRLTMPIFADFDKVDNNEIDHWEKELMPPLPFDVIRELEVGRNHTLVSGSLRGSYKVAKEVKKGLNRVSFSNITYNLDVYANGFIVNNVAYLTLNGTVNRFGALHGSLIATDIFDDDKDS